MAGGVFAWGGLRFAETSPTRNRHKAVMTVKIVIEFKEG
jgi:hypothetical protein